MEENEMIDYEKKYNEALERAQKTTRAGGDVAMEIVQYIFPELRESEDERIRNNIIVSVEMNGGLTQARKSEIYAYLEKQKEQKPEERFKEAREKYQVEWSEEDEKIITRLIDYFESFRIVGVTTKWEGLDIQEVITLLKSLRPQYHGDITMTEAYKMGLEAGKASSWRPSEEQMDALQSAINACESEWVYQDDELRSLLTDLEKLI